ncbi:universal stress protein [Tunicatimonas pelagia]|uniref:universal stress protein n=1 Tax=Tunicatimonas pelagia TaxID=931531 RepID=UPI002665B073|nr:universal stress protein [Tunicatimonas pelagia]WKN44833.1 universal stress protein [Tunicatimonas pelagia]
MSTVLIPLDLTYLSKCALEFGSQLANLMQARLHLISVVEPPRQGRFRVSSGEYEPDSMGHFYQQQLLRIKASQVEEHQDELQQWFPALDIAPTVRVGDPLPTVLDEIEQQAIDLVIIGGDCFHASDHALEQLIRESTCPVLVVKCRLDKITSYRDVVLLVDPQRDDSQVLSHLIVLQRWLNARLHLLWVNTPNRFTATKAATQTLDRYRIKYGLDHAHPVLWDDESETEGLLRYSQSLDHAFLALAVHSRSFVQRLLRSDPASQLITSSAHPVWTFGH